MSAIVTSLPPSAVPSGPSGQPISQATCQPSSLLYHQVLFPLVRATSPYHKRHVSHRSLLFNQVLFPLVRVVCQVQKICYLFTSRRRNEIFMFTVIDKFTTSSTKIFLFISYRKKNTKNNIAKINVLQRAM